MTDPNKPLADVLAQRTTLTTINKWQVAPHNGIVIMQGTDAGGQVWRVEIPAASIVQRPAVE